MTHPQAWESVTREAPDDVNGSEGLRLKGCCIKYFPYNNDLQVPSMILGVCRVCLDNLVLK